MFEIGGHRYNGVISESAPGQIVISAIDASEEGDEGVLVSPEANLIARLVSVTQYTFRTGRLLLMGFENQRPVMFDFAVFVGDQGQSD